MSDMSENPYLANLIEPLQAELDEVKESIKEPLAKMEQLSQAIALLKGEKPNGGDRAPRGANQQKVLDYLTANADSTVATMHEATGIEKPTLHNLMTNLVKSGKVKVNDKVTPKTYKVA